MIHRFCRVAFLMAFSLFWAAATSALGAEGQSPPSDKPATNGAVPGTSESPAAAPVSKPSSPSPSDPQHVTLLKDAKHVEGLLSLYRKGNSLFVEFGPGDYSNEYIVLISIARGISQGMLLGGMSWGFGDDWVWSFRKIDDNVHIIRKNVRFKADKGSPEATAVKYAYTDSVLFSLPIVTKGPKGGDLVDLTSVFMSDLPQISTVLPGFMFAANKSTWASVKGFSSNMELEVAATYASGGHMNLDTVPDSRGATINVHYSISKIPGGGYASRLADDRVGYFLTVIKDFSKKKSEDQFVRYVNRWKLQKADSSAAMSPPTEPIIFWLEKTVPFKYRKPIRDGILEWNKAFAKAGFIDALEVRQQPDDADWDPEDINYNTFRWITANAGLAMGPSRVNPYTGQILDADIIFDADFLTAWKQEFETLTPQSIALMTGGKIQNPLPNAGAASGLEMVNQGSLPGPCKLSHGMAHQLAFGLAALNAQADPKVTAELQEKLVMQGLKEVTMHELGHTLGLRHNFKGSAYLSLADLNNPAKTALNGMVASVMDYNPTNLVPKEIPQGDFFPTTIGPYDLWAIEYGYRQFSGDEEGELKKIATRAGEPALKYATDEDTRGEIDPDPESNRYDLGNDALAYAKQRAQLIAQVIPTLVDKNVKEGEDYTKARKAFNVVLSQYGQAMYFTSRYVGGLYTSRTHRGDKDGKSPITVIEPAKQREALALLEQQVFNDKPFQFPPELYNQLASTNWSHWGLRTTSNRKDFPVHDVILMWQERILAQLISPVTLERIHDAELKIPADQDAFTTAELIERLTKAVFVEVENTKEGAYTNRKPAITSLRRNLQRSYLKEVSNMAMGRSSAPQDCQTVAYVELTSLKARIDILLAGNVKLDAYSRAHLQESSKRIEKVLDAKLSLLSP
ncbi:MAG: zinc-dependent metalloprotease [Planctomycetota bacterium]|nr:zinc-dependent metalloprotease [Planctomycetota bacterium]